MKQTSSFLAAVLLAAIQISAQEVSSPEQVIQQVADKLASVKLLGYWYTFEFSVPSQGRQMKVEADAFFDLRLADGGSKFRFQFSGADRFSAFNGTERFTLDKPAKKMYVESTSTFESFGDTLLMHSPIALKYALPKIIADDKVQKTVTEIGAKGIERYLIEFQLPKAIISAGGAIVEIRPDHTNIYRITVDKSSLLPIEVFQANDKNDEVIKTTYAGVTEKPAAPDAMSWFFSSYLNEYAIEKKDKLTLIEAGTKAPDFSLTELDRPSKISLDKYNGKLVLLEFWIVHCGFSIAAVPKLNALSQKFRRKGLEVVAINMYDPIASIEAFRKKNKPEFTILTGGDSIATAYGVESYPAIVLIGRLGKVVYSSSGVFEDQLEAAIAANLQE